jgi:hypothetical protein
MVHHWFPAFFVLSIAALLREKLKLDVSLLATVSFPWPER